MAHGLAQLLIAAVAQGDVGNEVEYRGAPLPIDTRGTKLYPARRSVLVEDAKLVGIRFQLPLQTGAMHGGDALAVVRMDDFQEGKPGKRRSVKSCQVSGCWIGVAEHGILGHHDGLVDAFHQRTVARFAAAELRDELMVTGDLVEGSHCGPGKFVVAAHQGLGAKVQLHSPSIGTLDVQEKLTQRLPVMEAGKNGRSAGFPGISERIDGFPVGQDQGISQQLSACGSQDRLGCGITFHNASAAVVEEHPFGDGSDDQPQSRLALLEATSMFPGADQGTGQHAEFVGRKRTADEVEAVSQILSRIPTALVAEQKFHPLV